MGYGLGYRAGCEPCVYITKVPTLPYLGYLTLGTYLAISRSPPTRSSTSHAKCTCTSVELTSGAAVGAPHKAGDGTTFCGDRLRLLLSSITRSSPGHCRLLSTSYITHRARDLHFHRHRPPRLKKYCPRWQRTRNTHPRHNATASRSRPLIIPNRHLLTRLSLC